MKRDLAHWRWIYRTTGGWRGVRWCLNCYIGPRAWKLFVVSRYRHFQMMRRFKKMTPEQRSEMIAILKDLGNVTS